MRFPFFALLVLALLGTIPVYGQLKLAAPFADNMVLQREMPVKVFGRGSPGSEVKVSFQGQTKTGKVDADGKWTLLLDPLQVGPAGELKASSGSHTVSCKDVVVGEVWLCAGQSNMGYGVAHSLPDDTRLAAILERDDLSNLRLFSGRKWIVGSKEAFAKASSMRVAFANELHQLHGVPIGILGASKSGSKASGWVTREMLTENDEVVQAFGSREALETAMMRPLDGIASNYEPKVTPMVGYTVRAMFWDQGEAGSGIRGMPFPVMTRALFTGWRKAWGQDDMPIIYMSKPSGGGPAFDPSSELTRSSTPYMALKPQKKLKKDKPSKGWGNKTADRQHFLPIAELAGTAMIITSDLQADIHPKMKADYASRAVLVARALVYGEDVQSIGPIYASHEVQDGAIRITFKETGKGLTHRHADQVTGFEISSGDGAWIHAQAAILNETQVKVWHDLIANPAHVRYAWGNKIAWTNLYNEEGLPAVTFTTDPKVL